MFIGDVLLLTFVFAVYGSIMIIEDLRHDDRIDDGFVNMMVYFPVTNQVSYYEHSDGMDVLRVPYELDGKELPTINYGIPGTAAFYRKFFRVNKYLDPNLFPITRVCHIIRNAGEYIQYDPKNQKYCDFSRYFNGYSRCLDSTMIDDYDVCKIIGEIRYFDFEPRLRIIILHPNGMYFAVQPEKLHQLPGFIQPLAKLCFKYHKWLTGTIDDIVSRIYE